VLNGYRVKERLPDNIGEMTLSLRAWNDREGKDVTVVTYGACCRIVMEAADKLSSLN
jgi:pyruvate/2-oxoglutarate/acetoin dehydrogenase E1 component